MHIAVPWITVSAPIEPRGSIFQNRFLDGASLEFRCISTKIVHFSLYLSLTKLAKRTIVQWVRLYSRKELNWHRYGIFNKFIIIF